MEATRRDHAGDGYDSDALRDALASVETWDVVELSALFALETSEDVDCGATKHVDKPTPYTRTTIPREPRKQETLALQVKIASLQRIIESERAKRQRSSLTDAPGVLANEWREIAERQAVLRTASLVENEKLKMVLAAQASDARKIVRVGERVAQIEQAFPPVPVVSFDKYRGPDLDPLEQLAQLDQQLLVASDVFRVEAFRTQGRESFSTSHFRSCDPDSPEGIEFEYLMGWVVPFAVRDVADALWVQGTRPTAMNKHVQFMVVHKEPRAEVSRFLAPPQEGQNESFVHGQTATRRSLENEEDGSIEVLANIRGRVINPKKGGVILNGHEWMRVEPVALADDVEGPMSRVQWCHRVRVRSPTYETMKRKERVAWVHSIVTGPVQRRVKRDLARNIQNIENLLLTPRELPMKSQCPVTECLW